MLQAGLFPDFKGARTLLLWGDADGIAELHSAVIALSRGDTSEIQLGGDPNISIMSSDTGERPSELSQSERGLTWLCSRSELIEVEALIDGLDDASSGHQFIDIVGLADQLIVSKNEYRESLRPPQEAPLP